MKAIFNILLRGLTLASKFALLFFLAKFLKPADVGLFGLFLGTISYCVLVIGLDFYTYSQRELLSHQKKDYFFIIYHQFSLYGIAYIILLPILSFLFLFNLIPIKVAGWFFLILILEHLAQEVNRLLVVLNRQLFAGVVLFVRGGIWIWFMLVYMFFQENMRNLNIVFASWALGSASAVLLGIRAIYLESRPWQQIAYDWKWIARGLRTGIIFFVATICFRALFTVDKYFIKHFAGPDLLGVYTLYAGMAMALFSFLDSGVFVFLYPKVVQSFRQGNVANFQYQFGKLLKYSILATCAMAIPAAVLAKPVISLIGKPIYLKNIQVFFLLLVTVCLFAFGMIPHYALYAFGADRHILIAHLGGVIIFCLTAFVFAHIFPFMGVPLGMIIAFLWILVYKVLICRMKWKLYCAY